MTFHHICVRFGLLTDHLSEKSCTQLTTSYLCILTICNFSYFPFGFEGRTGVLLIQFLVFAYLLLLESIAYVFPCDKTTVIMYQLS